MHLIDSSFLHLLEVNGDPNVEVQTLDSTNEDNQHKEESLSNAQEKDAFKGRHEAF